MAQIKLFVWREGVLPDYTDGMAVAVATSPESARKKIMASPEVAALLPITRAQLEKALSREPEKALAFREAAALCSGGG